MRQGWRLVGRAHLEVLHFLDRVLLERPRTKLLRQLSDEALEAELDRRRRVKAKSPRNRAAQQHRSDRENKIAEYYGLLGVPYGSNLGTVRQAYHRMMREIHPDRNGPDAGPQPLRRAQSVTEAYQELERALRTPAQSSSP